MEENKMRAPTENEINEFTERLGIIPNAYKGEVSFKYMLKRYCENLVNNKERPKMTALYIETTKYVSRYNGSEIRTMNKSERNLRFVVEKLWKEPHTETFDEVFKYYKKKSKPTNLEFVGACSSYLLHEINKKEYENTQKTKTDTMQFEKEFLINKLECDATSRLNSVSSVPDDVKEYLNYTISNIIKDSIQDIFKYVLYPDVK